MDKVKKSFIAYSDWKETFDELPDEEAGKLIKHIFAYVNNENPVTDSILIKAVFANIKSTLIRDMEKWETQLQQRKEAGKKSAELRLTKSNERSTSVDESTRNPTDNVSVSVSDNVSVSVKDKKEKYNFSTALINYGFDSDLVKDWLVVRKNKKCSNTETAFKGFISQVEKTNMDKNFVLKKCIERSWGGFDADWLKNITPEYKKPMYWHFKFRNNLGTYYTPDPVPEEQGEEFKQQQFARIDKPQLIEEYLKPQSWRN